MNDILDTVAQELITADPDDLQDLGALLTLFESLQRTALRQGQARIAQAASASAALLKKILLDEGDRTPGLTVLCSTVSAMQHIVRSGDHGHQAQFPPELGLATDAAQAGSPAAGHVPPYRDSSIFDDFLSEIESDLDALEGCLLQLENSPDRESVCSLKRTFHTLKGEAGIFQLDDIVRCCHCCEDLIDGHSDTKLPIDRLLAAKDWLKEVADALREHVPLPPLPDSLGAERDAPDGPGGDSPATVPGGRDMQGEFVLPGPMNKKIFAEFLNDQESALENMEWCLLRLEKEPDPEALAKLKRIIHTLKGESAVMNLSAVEDVCHHAEDTIDASGAALPVDRLFVVHDWLKNVFHALKRGRPVPSFDASMLRRDMHAAAPETVGAQPATGAGHAISADFDLLSDFVSEVQEHLDAIDVRLLSLEGTPDDPDLLNAVFRVFHTVKGAAGFLALDEISRLAHTTEHLLDLARKGSIVLRGESVDVIFEAVDEMKKLVGTIAEALSRAEPTYAKSPGLDGLLQKIQRILHAAPAADTGEASEATPGTPPRAAGAATRTAPQTGTMLNADAQPPKAQTFKVKESIKVDSENLDKLIDAIGELVITEAMVRQNPQLRRTSSSGLQQSLQQMNKITRELQQLGMTLRMVPVRATFQKMARVVRDLAKKSGKNIEFAARGEDTMLDKSVVDRIGDPLIHLVRNSVDHGIESSGAERVRKGKSGAAHITLTACHKGGSIHIEIHDDGRGLDRKAIIEKALDKGLIKARQVLTEREIYDLIMLPGFSTAKRVTDVSGRGVGMDVVKRAIEDMRGTIEIYSEKDKGTTFSMRLPLTLAIIDGMLVGVGDEKYIIPTISIVESIRLQPGEIVTVAGRGEMISVRDSLMPLFRLANLFELAGAKQDPCDAIVIVVEDSGKRTGLMVDALLGQQSTVIKSLGASLKGLPGISGGSILSDGRVGIILDIAGIVRIATNRNVTAAQWQPAAEALSGAVR